MAEIINFKEELKEVLVKDSLSLNDLYIKSMEIYEDSEDYMIRKANTSNIRFNENGGFTFIIDGGEKVTSSISRYALGQISSKIGVPANYIDKCVKSGMIDLAQDNVNTWLDEYRKDLFIREYRGTIRGVLSNKYSVCDSHEILEVLDDTIDLDKYKIKGSFLNEERLHARFINREMLPVEDEDLFAGIFVDSSDVGRNVLTVKFGIYKQVCTNGLVVSKGGGVLFSQKHIGISKDEFRKGLYESLKNVPSLMEHAVEWIEFARNKSLGYDVYDMSEKQMEDFIRTMKFSAGLSPEKSDKVISLMQSKYGGTRWGLINSLTEVAQDFTLERRLEIEKVAGNMLVA